MFVRLSHTLKEKDAAWPGNPPYRYTQRDFLGKTATSNSYIMEFHNHSGTHMDAPNHINNDAPRISQLPLETFFFDHPVLIEIPKSYGELISAAELEPHAEAIVGADLLMIRSGFQSKRTEDPEGFGARGPAMSAEACKWLMDHFQLKALAMDWVSLGSPLYPKEGGAAHQYLIGGYEGRYTYIIEDATFEGIVGKNVKRVYAFPVFAEGIDSSVVTMIAEVE